MMKRRHWIVHRVDRNRSQGTGGHGARSISLSTVREWKDEVEAAVQTIFEEI
jgi:dihydroxyacetone kinase